MRKWIIAICAAVVIATLLILGYARLIRPRLYHYNITPTFGEFEIPEDGTWYCAELQMQLSFGENAPEGYCYVSGRKIRCTELIEIGTPYLFALCCDPDDPEFPLGESLFFGIIVECEENEMKVQDYESENVYVFARTE